MRRDRTNEWMRILCWPRVPYAFRGCFVRSDQSVKLKQQNHACAGIPRTHELTHTDRREILYTYFNKLVNGDRSPMPGNRGLLVFARARELRARLQRDWQGPVHVMYLHNLRMHARATHTANSESHTQCS